MMGDVWGFTRSLMQENELTNKDLAERLYLPVGDVESFLDDGNGERFHVRAALTRLMEEENFLSEFRRKQEGLAKGFFDGQIKSVLKWDRKFIRAFPDAKFAIEHLLMEDMPASLYERLLNAWNILDFAERATAIHYACFEVEEKRRCMKVIKRRNERER